MTSEPVAVNTIPTIHGFDIAFVKIQRSQDYIMIRMEQQMLKELVARELPNFSPTIDDARVVVDDAGVATCSITCWCW